MCTGHGRAALCVKCSAFYIAPHLNNAVSVTVLCHVYITMSSYLSMRAHVGIVAQELLQAVAERMEVPQGELVLVAVTYPGGK